MLPGYILIIYFVFIHHLNDNYNHFISKQEIFVHLTHILYTGALLSYGTQLYG